MQTVLPMIASLPMYDWPEVRHATDGWWAGIARHAGMAHVQLDRRDDFATVWEDAALALSQTCGYPFTHKFRDRLGYVATPHYVTEGCEGPNYRSFLMARVQQPLAGFKGGVAVINAGDSMSGMLALKLLFHPLAEGGRFFRQVKTSGAHPSSLTMLQKGEADICTVDAVCVGLAKAHRPELLEGLHIVGQSPIVPGLPYISLKPDVDRWRKVLATAFADPDLAPHRDVLLLSGYTVLAPHAYDLILTLEGKVERSGGLAL